ncbi:MAG: hypothetical protein EOP09_14345, partial [Proteobacteria bacterium]
MRSQTLHLLFTLFSGLGLASCQLASVDSTKLLSLRARQDLAVGTLDLSSRLVSGGSPLTVRYSVMSRFSTTENLVLRFSSDGKTFVDVATLSARSAQYTYVIPTGLNGNNARFSLDVLNGSGNRTKIFSELFTIDSVAPAAPAVSLASVSTHYSPSLTFSTTTCTDTSALLVREVGDPVGLNDSDWSPCNT